MHSTKIVGVFRVVINNSNFEESGHRDIFPKQILAFKPIFDPLCFKRRREPSGAAKSLIAIAMKRPDVLLEVFGKVA